MKKQLLGILLLLSIPLFSQTRMIIYKTDGTIDSVLLSQISSVTFSNTSGTVPAQGLVAYWPLDGNAVDSSGNGYNGTVLSATPTQNRFGIDSSAFSFDGNSSAINFGNILNSVFCAPVATFSVSGWAYLRSNGSNTNLIIGKEAGGIGPYQWDISYTNGYLTGAVDSDTLAQNYIKLANPVSPNQWFHFVLVFDGNQPESKRIQLYVNGSNSSTFVEAKVGSLGTTTVPCQQTLEIGAELQGYLLKKDDLLNGDVDDVRIYNRALSAAEVMNLYLAPN